MANCACAVSNRRDARQRLSSLGRRQGTVVVAVVAVRVVKMAGYPIVHMIAVRHRLVATSGPVDVARFVPTAAVVGGAAVGVLA
jgi:hypothetical protein